MLAKSYFPAFVPWVTVTISGGTSMQDYDSSAQVSSLPTI